MRGYAHAIDEKPVEEVDHRHGPTAHQLVTSTAFRSEAGIGRKKAPRLVEGRRKRFDRFRVKCIIRTHPGGPPLR